MTAPAVRCAPKRAARVLRLLTETTDATPDEADLARVAVLNLPHNLAAGVDDAQLADALLATIRRHPASGGPR